jgi:phage protein D
MPPVEIVVPITTGQDFYVPYFEVDIGGRAQGQHIIRDIMSVSYKDNIDQIDSFDITINNWDAAKRTFKYSDDELFDPGKTLDLWMGYYGQNRLRLMVRGQITALRPSFPAGGASTLAVSGLNVLHKLRTSQVSYTYVDQTDEQIAKTIGQRLGIDVVADSSSKQYKYLIQDNQYDIIFLMERARRIGYDLFVDEQGKEGKPQPPKLHFGSSVHVNRPTYKLTYGRTLIDFKPDLTTANQVSEVRVRAWDSVHKKAIEGKADRSQLSIKTVGASGGQAAIEQSFKHRKDVIVTEHVESQAEADQLALSTLQKNATQMLKASGSTVGLPDLRAGSALSIDGLGTRFSGRYFVTASTHTIGDGGYTTQFECRREEIT